MTRCVPRNLELTCVIDSSDNIAVSFLKVLWSISDQKIRTGNWFDLFVNIFFFVSVCCLFFLIFLILSGVILRFLFPHVDDDQLVNRSVLLALFPIFIPLFIFVLPAFLIGRAIGWAIEKIYAGKKLS